jgi:hypothetical protein
MASPAQAARHEKASAPEGPSLSTGTSTSSANRPHRSLRRQSIPHGCQHVRPLPGSACAKQGFDCGRGRSAT